jgi:hypothetical protein
MDTKNAANESVAQETLKRMLARSASDIDFRRKLIADPRAAVAEFAGRDVSTIPESFNVKFVENAPGTQTIVLPNAVDTNAELSESELETVSGGTSPLGILVLVVVAEQTGIIDIIPGVGAQ